MPSTVYNELWLPIEPFRSWLREQLDATARNSEEPDAETNKTLLGFQIGLSPKRITEYLDSPERETVAYSTVDRVLIRHGGAHPRDLYGFEYDSIPLGHRRLVTCERCGSDLIRASSLCGFCLEEAERNAA